MVKISHNIIELIIKTILIFNIFCLTVYSQTKVSKINYEGNSYYSDKNLNGFITLKEGYIFSENQFELDLKNILTNYRSAGFLDCIITGTEKQYNFDSTSVDISITMDEGRQVLTGEIIITGNTLFSTKYIKDNMETREGEVLDEVKLDADLKEILNLYETKGYSFASVNINEISEYLENGDRKLKVTVAIEENERIKIDNIVIEGNTTTNDNVIKREIILGESSLVSRENLLEIRQRLENTGYFEKVEQPKILKYNNQTVLLIGVKEGNTNTFDGILGYVPPSQNEESGYITGLVNLSIRNLFGTGRKVEARFKKEIKTTQELELKYLEPWLFGYPLNVNLAFLQRVEDSSYVKRELGTRSDILLSRKFTLSAIFNFERVIPTSTVNLFTIFDSRVLAAGIELRFDSRDYVYNPTSGIFYKTSYSAGQKKIYNAESFENYNIPSDFTVQKGALDLDFYHSFFKRQSSLVGVHGIEIRSPRFETADLYRLGGINTVRGYREGQFLASRAAWSNLELRYALTRRSFAAVFFDLGYYLKPEDQLYNIPLQEGFIYGYGLGIRIETALGMFGVSYALGKGDSILEGKVHFGLINDF